MSNKIYGYARVSTKEQNLDRQVEVLRSYGIGDRDIITDKQSGKDFNREGYQTLKNSLLRSGDTLVIRELDGLGRDMDLTRSSKIVTLGSIISYGYLFSKGVSPSKALCGLL